MLSHDDYQALDCSIPGWGDVEGIELIMTAYFSRLTMVVVCIGLLGCATQSAVQFTGSYDPSQYDRVRVDPCIDRTGSGGQRNLSVEATESLTKKLVQTNIFTVAPDGRLILACEIEKFVEGSALKRWIVPGWGRTQAQVAVMVYEKPDNKVLATLRSQAEVAAGGLYTIGADEYILDAAFDDIVNQLKVWAKARTSGTR